MDSYLGYIVWRSYLEVGFSVEAGRLDVAYPVRLRRREQDQIRGKKLLTFDSHNVPNFNLLPLLFNKVSLTVEHFALRRVNFFVLIVPFEVLHDLLDAEVYMSAKIPPPPRYYCPYSFIFQFYGHFSPPAPLLGRGKWSEYIPCLDSGDEQDDAEGADRDVLARRGYTGDLLKQTDTKEKYVGIPEQ